MTHTKKYVKSAAILLASVDTGCPNKFEMYITKVRKLLGHPVVGC